MTDAKHTPGPWTADLDAYPIMITSELETWPLVDDGVEVGRTGVFVANTGLNKANARLIAAAPDLLEALQECLREHGGFTIKGECERRARVAIAKAQGGAA